LFIKLAVFVAMSAFIDLETRAEQLSIDNK